MNRTLAACLVRDGGTVRDAMLALDRGAGRIALAVAADGRLIGVVTDGDVRRALLGGAALDDAARAGPQPELSRGGADDGRSDVLELMRARRVSAIPVVDGEGCPVGLHLLHEFLERVSRHELGGP